MRLIKPDDNVGGMLLLALPQVVVHQIDAWSPLLRYLRNENLKKETAATSYSYPETLERETDLLNGTRELPQSGLQGIHSKI